MPADLAIKLVAFECCDFAYATIRDINFTLVSQTLDPEDNGPLEPTPVVEPVNPQGEFSSYSQHLSYASGFFDYWLDPFSGNERERDDNTGDGGQNQHVFFNDSAQFHWCRPADELCDVRTGVVCSPNNYLYSPADGELPDGVIRMTALANFDRWAALGEDEYRLAKLRWYDRVVESAVRFVPARLWTSPRTGARYPVAMRLELGARTLDLQPLFDDQELDTRASTGTIYWEGAVRAFEAGRTIGRGYLELTGYAGALRL